MIRNTLIVVMVFQLIGIAHPPAGIASGLSYLKAPMVQWNKNRLTGELKNVPVSRLLEELIKSKHYGCTVKGQLQGHISIKFENMTVEEIIQKVMRNNGYNHTILSSSEDSNSGRNSGIDRLTIYQGGNSVHFLRVTKSTQATVSAGKKVLPPQPHQDASNPKTMISSDQFSTEIEKLSLEFKALLDDMLASKKISKEEYQKELADMMAKSKTN